MLTSVSASSFSSATSVTKSVINRREFLKYTGLGAASLGLLGAAAVPAAAQGQAVRLTILHTNDMHSRIEPFPDNAAQWAGMGGMARRAALIEQVRRHGTQRAAARFRRHLAGHALFQLFPGRTRVQAHEPDGLRTPARSATTTSTTGWRACTSSCPTLRFRS